MNDQILEVNGVSLVGVTQYFAAQTLKATNGVVRWEIIFLTENYGIVQHQTERFYVLYTETS